jgi:AFG3 family protein
MDENKNKDKKDPKMKIQKFNWYWIWGFVLLALMGLWFVNQPISGKVINEYTFTEDFLKKGKVEKLVIVNKEQVEVYLTKDAYKADTSLNKENKFGLNQKEIGPHYIFKVADLESFQKKIDEAQIEMPYDQKVALIPATRRPLWDSLGIFLPIIIIVLLWFFIMRRVSGGMGGPGGQIFNIGKSKASLYDKDTKVNVTFDDVAGLEEAKEEVKEVVDFLRNPKKYTSLGGKIPKGVLLVGPPGTGKTLIAKAMAGEAKVPFFSISGSEFVEMFVGVGASRVRDLFKQAREKAPCIIFIDEIDAIGRARGKNMMQSNDERENTLNQLLVEMDGFSGDKGVIILAATNRPDVLDAALLRPGRFDRQISIDAPDLVGREAIFKVHLKPLKTDQSIVAKRLAEQTPGFAGAEIANVCNEAALIAARRGKSQIDMKDFQDAVDRVIGGLEKKNKIILPNEKEIIAYHEAGHAVCGWFLENAHPLVKVSIVPRGVAALGYAQYLPKEKYLTRTEEILDQMCMTMGGRAAEKLVYNKISTGAVSDLDSATKMAYAMVVIYGMSEKVGNLSYYEMLSQNSFSKPYSEDTARVIDLEIKDIINEQYQRAQDLLKDKEKELHILAKTLLEKEVLFKSDLEELIGPRPFHFPDEDVVEIVPHVEPTPPVVEPTNGVEASVETTTEEV